GATGSNGGTGGTGGSTGGTGGSTGGTGGSTGGTGGSTGGASGTAGSGGNGGATGGSAGAGAGGIDAGAGRGGTAGTGGSAGAAGGGAGGASGSGGATDSGATGGSGGTGTTDAGGGTCMPGDGGTAKFSFFATSLVAMRRVSGSDKGFGGDLRFGKTDGLSGADEICRVIADYAFPGAGCKQWRAFLSATKGPAGTQVNAIDRVGAGPWYDRLGRVFAMNSAGLQQTRPQGADPAIINDFPNEDGVPNHAPDGNGMQVDNHDFLTGSDATGKLYMSGLSGTCQDWTSGLGTGGKPRCGHTWPRGTQSWISILDEAGCAPGVNIVEMGGPNPADPSVGSGGGYGGIYCFALTP
ncbi:MAG TPA: hypothetical protein VK550_00035, partial [Polyangiaceae bacterium]|nr:hypothetical protein [Polyangiaceae bacterium]